MWLLNNSVGWVSSKHESEDGVSEIDKYYKSMLTDAYVKPDQVILIASNKANKRPCSSVPNLCRPVINGSTESESSEPSECESIGQEEEANNSLPNESDLPELLTYNDSIQLLSPNKHPRSTPEDSPINSPKPKRVKPNGLVEPRKSVKIASPSTPALIKFLEPAHMDYELFRKIHQEICKDNNFLNSLPNFTRITGDPSDLLISAVIYACFPKNQDNRVSVLNDPMLFEGSKTIRDASENQTRLFPQFYQILSCFLHSFTLIPDFEFMARNKFFYYNSKAKGLVRGHPMYGFFRKRPAAGEETKELPDQELKRSNALTNTIHYVSGKNLKASERKLNSDLNYSYNLTYESKIYLNDYLKFGGLNDDVVGNVVAKPERVESLFDDDDDGASDDGLVEVESVGSEILANEVVSASPALPCASKPKLLKMKRKEYIKYKEKKAIEKFYASFPKTKACAKPLSTSATGSHEVKLVRCESLAAPKSSSEEPEGWNEDVEMQPEKEQVSTYNQFHQPQWKSLNNQIASQILRFCAERKLKDITQNVRDEARATVIEFHAKKVITEELSKLRDTRPTAMEIEEPSFNPNNLERPKLINSSSNTDSSGFSQGKFSNASSSELSNEDYQIFLDTQVSDSEDEDCCV